MGITRRELLMRVGQAGGYAAAFTTMQTLGLLPIPHAEAVTWSFTARAKGGQQIAVVDGPSPRVSARMVTVGDKLVLFGGDDGTNLLGDTWTWDGATWQQVATTGPSPREAFGMAAL